MTAVQVVLTAVREALAADPAVGGRLNGVFDGPVKGAALPHAEMGEVLAGDWGTKDRPGRELRVAVAVRDAGDSAARVREVAGAIEARIGALPRMLDGWEVASVAPVRCRVAAEGAGRWRATIEMRVRVLAG
ncbi:DUF3168 domain-containing protein [Sphingomonas aracearum]|uniref:DUF3168 domain-containing protein n=1 Tax=Sphingomonas aracearum TaxID=2283317 RepID=A0A369VTD6_9SPHN|nr:DUF3168 domain-containing protein [Sphingomonas aracearum]RDE04807.1 DUF3168 domain-containing protein [Sphingomonas aracearum]